MEIEVFLDLHQNTFFYHDAQNFRRRIPLKFRFNFLEIGGLKSALVIYLFQFPAGLFLVLGQGYLVVFQSNHFLFLNQRLFFLQLMNEMVKEFGVVGALHPGTKLLLDQTLFQRKDFMILRKGF